MNVGDRKTRKETEKQLYVQLMHTEDSKAESKGRQVYRHTSTGRQSHRQTQKANIKAG